MIRVEVGCMNKAQSRLKRSIVVDCLRAVLVTSAYFFATVSAGAQHQTSAAQLASEGWSAFEEGRLDDAKQLLDKAASLNPNDADYQAALAEVDSRMGEQDAAIEHFRKAIVLSPSNAEFRLNLAQILQTENKDQEALHVLQGAHPGAGLSDAWHFSRGFSLFRAGRFTAADEEFKMVAEKPGFRASASFFLGNIAYSQDEFEQAARYLATAVELGNVATNKAYNAYTYDYGLVLMKLGRYKDAAVEFKASIERYDRDPLPWMFLGRCDEQMGNYPVAIEMLETSIKKDPSFQLSYYELARLQQRHGDPKRAAELFRKIGIMKQEEITAEEDRAMKLRTEAGPH
jgi:tetratricopeptide (TPR) repeat protein